MSEKRPKLLIIGHARHGKDSFAEILRDKYGLSFKSSSRFVGERCIWDQWGKERYLTFEDMFEDRANHRALWKNLISAYCTPDKARTAKEMLAEGHDMYVGMRDIDEFRACREQKIFDLVLWVDRSRHQPPESVMSMDLESHVADHIILNNGTLEDLETQADKLVEYLGQKGFHWTLPEREVVTGTIPGAEAGPDYVPIPDMGDGEGPRFMSEDAFNRMQGRIAEARKSKTQVLALAPNPAPKGSIDPLNKPTLDEEEVDLSTMPEGAVPVLDHGYVKLVSSNGTDADIAQAARLSYGRGTKKLNKDEGLIRYLYMNAHTSPFEMVGIKVQMRLPIFVMRQLVRHRMANLNEYSGRYSIMPRLFYVPETSDIKGQSDTNKQGSEGVLDGDQALMVQRHIQSTSEAAFNTYEHLLKIGVSREMARIVLPLNTYTEVVWQMDLNNLLRFLTLRDDSHAQPEIRAYAQIIDSLVAQLFPLTYKAYWRKRGSKVLSMEELHALITGSIMSLPKSEQKKVMEIQKELQDFPKDDFLGY